eukprot:EG_transcript_1674
MFARDSGAVDKTNHLERLRLERLQREAARQRQAAATTLQAAARGHLTRVHCAAAMRDHFDRLEAASTVQLLALLGHFYNAERVPADHGRLMQVAEVLGRDGGQAYAKETCGTGTAEGAALYVVQVRRLSRYACRWLQRHPASPDGDACRLLDLLTALLPAPPLLAPVPDLYVQAGVFPAAAAVLSAVCLAGDPSSSPAMASALRLLQRLLAALPPAGGPWPAAFGAHILAVPNLLAIPDAFPALCNAAFPTPASLLAVTLPALATALEADGGPPVGDAWGWLYANLLGCVAACDPPALRACLRCLAALTPPAAVPRLAELLRPTDPKPGPQPKVGQLLDAHFLSVAFQAVAIPEDAKPAAHANPFALAPAAASSSSSVMAALPEGLASLCSVYAAFIRHFSLSPAAAQRGGRPEATGLLLDLMAPLSYSPVILPRLWQCLHAAVGNRWEGLGTAAVAPGLANTLLVFSHAYAYYLSCVDEEEFFEKQALFTLDQNITLVDCFRPLAFNAHHNLNLGDEPLKAAVSMVLRRLYEMDDHRPFCPRGHFTAGKDTWPHDIPLEALDQYNTGVAVPSPTLQRTLTLLHHVPFMVPFDHRVLIFRHWVAQDAARVGGLWGEAVRVRRESLFEDAYSAMNALPSSQWKGRLRVEFHGEAGFGDGVTKEFITELSKQAFSEIYGMFLSTPDKTLYPNPAVSTVVESPHSKYQFLGKLLGKALYEGILVEIPLARFFINALLGLPNKLMDVVSFDRELYKNLLALKHYPGDVQEDFGLNFTVVDEVYGEYRVRDLVPGGSQVPVTGRNRLQYLQAVTHYRLTAQIRDHTTALREGLSEVIPPRWLELFGPTELQTLISGDDNASGLDVGDWAAHTVYGGGYGPDHRTIRLFWDVVSQWSPERQRALLRFTTSVGKAPLLGFRYMHPPFNVHQHGSLDCTDRLPTAATCMCQLKLPPYQDRRTMEEKLLYAISADRGFDFS